MNKLVVTLAEDDLVELQAILMDDDERAALEFLKTRLAARIPKKGTAPCDSSREEVCSSVASSPICSAPDLYRWDPSRAPPGRESRSRWHQAPRE